jgi:hypothetical protein
LAIPEAIPKQYRSQYRYQYRSQYRYQYRMQYRSQYRRKYQYRRQYWLFYNSEIATDDIYASEMKEAVGFGFVARFSQNNTFRPQLAVTREQLVSLVWESWKGIQGANITFPSHVSIRPYSDLPISRWSAGKILFARDNKIVSGYQDETFKPTQPVTRAELMAVL